MRKAAAKYSHFGFIEFEGVKIPFSGVYESSPDLACKQIRDYITKGEGFKVLNISKEGMKYPEMDGRVIPAKVKRVRRKDTGEGLLPGMEESFNTQRK